MRGFRIVVAKECLDNLRDRRTLLSSSMVAVLGPLLFVGMMIFVLDRALGESNQATEVSVIGAEFAPQLIEYLQQHNTQITTIDEDQPQALVASGEHDLIMVIQPNYTQRYRLGQTNTLSLIYDSSELSTTRRHMAQLRGLIGQYGRTIGALRLQLRGIDPGLARPLQTQEVDIASPAARALAILASLPYFLVLVVFMGGFYLAIDTTAGEREHGSLEPLLIQPISRAALVLAKISATAIFGAASVLLFLISLYLALPLVPFERIGMALEFTFQQLVAVFSVAIPLVLFAAALLTVVASFAKSYKEAQTYLTIVILIPTLPLIVAQLLNVDTTLGIMFIPSLSQANLMADMIKNDPVSIAHVAASMLSTLGYAAVLAWIAVQLYRREGILG